MRVNVYAEEITDRVEIVEKEVEGNKFTGLRFYLELPTSLPKGVYLGGTEVGHALYEPVSDNSPINVKGPFYHRHGDDDSAAVTFWGKRDLRTVLAKALSLLDEHYAKRDLERKTPNPFPAGPPYVSVPPKDGEDKP